MGIDAVPIIVETDVAFGMGAFTIVGLPDASVKESRDRIRAAIKNSGFSFPRYRITVNLAPADIRKQGPLYDLPIALSILIAQGDLPPESITQSLVMGELALDGSVRPIHGVLACALMAQREGRPTLFVPDENAMEAACIDELQVIPVKNLRDTVEHLNGRGAIQRCVYSATETKPAETFVDFAHVKGQTFAKRGLEIAAAGSHNVLFKGPPGTGKTLLARAFASILPPLSKKESIEVTSIASVAGTLCQKGLVTQRPFRSPHHSSSAIALVGGGPWPKPGEASLAHRGVLS